MQGNEFVWLASIILGMTLVGWLVLDWIESTQHWDRFDVDASDSPMGHGEAHTPDALDVEMELMLCYPLDPFAPALLWRPQPQDQWIEGQEIAGESVATNLPAESSPAIGASEAS